MKKFAFSSLKSLILAFAMIAASVTAQAQSGVKWSTGGINASQGDFLGTLNYSPIIFKTSGTQWMTLTSFGYFGIGISNPAYKLDVNGRAHFTGNVLADSSITVMHLYAIQKVTTDALQVNNNAQLKGITIIGNNITIDGANSSISSSAGALSFGSNNLQTTGIVNASGLNVSSNITANHITSQAIQTNYLTSDSVNTRVINAQKFLLNGIGLTQSPWIKTTNGIVIDPAVQNKDVYMNRLFVQESVNIGNFRFSNGGVLPSPGIIRDTIKTPYKLAVIAEGQAIELKADTVTMGNRVGIGVKNPQFALDVAGNAHFHDYLWVEDGIIVGKSFVGESGKVDSLWYKKISGDTAFAKFIQAINLTAARIAAENLVTDTVSAVVTKAEQVKVGGEGNIFIDGSNNKITSGTGLIDFGNTNLKTSGKITADSLHVTTSSFDSLHVQNRIKVGNSITIEGYPGVGGLNHIYTDATGDPTLYIQSNTNNFNTVINANNNGKVGIGTVPADGLKLHIKGYTCMTLACSQQQLPTAETSTIMRIEDETYGSPTVPSSDRTAWWDFITSANNHKFFIKSNSGDGTNNNNVMTMTETGNVGIGTVNPQAKLHISGPGDQNIDISTTDALGSYMRLMAVTSNGETESQLQFRGKMRFVKPLGGITRMIIDEDGNVGIGTDSPDYKLDVCGTIRAKEIIVDETAWCDYKFDKDHKRMTPEEKAKYYEENRHLFGIAPGSEIEKNGLKVAETMKGIVMNIEDNSLDIIDLYKIIEKQNNLIEILKKRIEILEQK